MSDFIDFARGYGLILDYAVPDNRWHRTKTEDKPKRRNGAYIFDGSRGAVINFATMSKGEAWRDGARAGQIDRAALKAQRAISEAQERARHLEAKRAAESMVSRATVDTHPYLVAKGFPEERGLVLDGELLIPMRELRNYAQINSMQRIKADGSKLFLPGGKAKGSVFFLGQHFMNERYLCEGYATGLSIRAALKEQHRIAQVVICFSAGNLAHIGKMLTHWRAVTYVIADNDASGTGAKAAEETGLRWIMPPDVGTDANDLHRQQGIRALVKLLDMLDRNGLAERRLAQRG